MTVYPFEMPEKVAKGCVQHLELLLANANKAPDADPETVAALIGLKEAVSLQLRAGIEPVVVPEHHKYIFMAVVEAEIDSNPQAKAMMALTLMMEQIIKMLGERDG